MRAIAPFIVGLCLTMTSCTSTRVAYDAGGSVVGTIISPIDGDTLSVRIGARRHDVRLIGVNTPETKHPTKPVECGGKEASALTARLFPQGTRVRLVRDIEARDRFGRLLGYLYRVNDGLFLNEVLLDEGYAEAYPFEPNTTFATHFAERASKAKLNNRGMWAFCRR